MDSETLGSRLDVVQCINDLYVWCFSGSILAATMSDPHAGGKLHRFVGLCIQRSGKGLGATFVLRNVIEGQGKGHRTLV